MIQILVIEDEADVRENLEEILRFKEYNVITAVNGLDGLEKIQNHQIDLVISDIMMPEMDGYELVKKVRESQSLIHIPVILLTAKTMVDEKVQGLEYGADDYITKPFNTKELLARVHNLIEVRKVLRNKSFMETPRKEVESVSDVFMRELYEIFTNNMENSFFAIEDVVSEMGLSKSTIQRRVKNYANKTFNQMLREYRLEQAKHLLEQKSGTISEIAFAVGFNSVSYFSYSFKNYFGYSPTDLDH